MENKNRDMQIYFWHKITTKDRALFYEHLSNLVDGGVTVTKAVRSFLEKTKNPKLASEVNNLLIFIDSGDSFSIAMKKMPFVFDKKELALIEAGESSGTIQRSFATLAKQLREQDELKTKVKGALTYPLIIMLFLLIAVIVIMAYVIPKIRPLFELSGTELPFATQTLIYVSDFMTNHFLAIIFVFAILIVSFKIYIKTETGRTFLDKFYLEIPLLGTVYRNYIISQISSNLGVLIGAGIPIIKTLYLSGESSNNAIYIEAINIVAKKVESGKKITVSIEEVDPEHKYFLSDFVQLISAGEKTSSMNKVCEKISAQYTREVDSSLSVLIKWIEPIAIFIAGIFVLWFAFAIFSAVLKITETVG
ncbi:type II secretion system F family protein [Candidatus Gracilibacteria bacterium]|nr:type II secretion system F family protein [Candidatus Gracilibacteria bacterium]